MRHTFERNQQKVKPKLSKKASTRPTNKFENSSFLMFPTRKIKKEKRNADDETSLFFRLLLRDFVAEPTIFISKERLRNAVIDTVCVCVCVV